MSFKSHKGLARWGHQQFSLWPGVKRVLYFWINVLFPGKKFDWGTYIFLETEIPYPRPTSFNPLSRLSSWYDNFIGVDRISMHVWGQKQWPESDLKTCQLLHNDHKASIEDTMIFFTISEIYSSGISSCIYAVS